jgi:hypothetical protein
MWSGAAATMIILGNDYLLIFDISTAIYFINLIDWLMLIACHEELAENI